MTPAIDQQAYNHNGQKIGPKGMRTRTQLIEITVKLLEIHGLRELSVIDVARAADMSPATFYVYFRGVPEVVLAALKNVQQTSPEVEALVEQDWLSDKGTHHAHSFVEAYTKLWSRNRTIFLVRNLAAEEGDRRFLDARLHAAAPMMKALSEQVHRAQDAKRIPSDLQPFACAGTLLMMLERLSAMGPNSSPANGGPSYATLKAAAAYSVSAMMGVPR